MVGADSDDLLVGKEKDNNISELAITFEIRPR